MMNLINKVHQSFFFVCVCVSCFTPTTPHVKLC